MADIAFLEKELALTEAALAGVQRAIEISERSGESTTDLRAQAQRYQEQILSLRQQLAAARATPPVESAGQTVTEGQKANDEGANVQSPSSPGASPPATLPTNAESSESQNIPDSGTNSPTRPLRQTQASPPPSIQNDDATPTNTAGVGAPSDDQTTPSDGQQANNITALVNKTARPITPQPNILDKFSSYTYSISIYLMTNEDYRRLLTTKKRFIPGYLLLIQSGGAPQSSGIQPTSTVNDVEPGGVSLTQGRNQYFPLDFYIDDLELKTINQGKGTGSSHNVTELKFKIIEPNGITLLDRLYKAVQQYINKAGGASIATANNNYAAQNYLMVIRFYGYDSQGNMITAQQIPSTDPRFANKSDVNAIVEKYVPFQFTGIKFRVANKLTEYDCSAVAVPNVIGTAQGRGVIPYNIELTATTLQNLFNGNAAFTATKDVNQQTRDSRDSGSPTSPDKASAAPSPTLTAGLVQALNKYQQEHFNNGTYAAPDIYKIVVHPVMASASIVPPGQLNRLATPMVSAQTGAQAKDGEKQAVNNDAKTVSATAGMSIVQFLDLAVRNSDYIYKQQNKIITTDQNGKQIEIPQSTNARAFAWYNITTEAKPYKPDPKRNDIAYEITYEIAPYGVAQLNSEYFPKGRFRGVQKRYPYWFTGENNSILTFEQDFNYLYYITVNSRQPAPVRPELFDYREAEKKLFSPNSGQTNQGEKGNRNEAGANAADYLYSPGDQGRVRMSIVGDPSWIAQGTLWSGIRSTKKPDEENVDVYFDAFLADGTINYDSREVLFEIAFNKPDDYNLQTGLMKGL